MAIQKITSGILADGAIVAADIANGSITTAKIADGNVTAAKLATGAALPSQSGNTTYYLTTDGTNSIWKAQTALAVANTQVTGLVTASQIANVANTQVTGSIEATQVGTTVSQLFGTRNRIINGNMVVSQRNGTSSVTPTDASYPIDRWTTWLSQASKLTFQQNAGAVTPPTGFTYYSGITSSSAYTVGVSEVFAFRQPIEGYNIADLDFGKATAKTITISFWVRSSLTGTFGGGIANSAYDRTYPFSYTISTANTWEQKTITIAGDTSGTWLTTNGIGMYVVFGLGVGANLSGTAGAWSGNFYISATGATSVVGTSGATFYITGVQLEVGSTATPFERRLYNQELMNCYRYHYRITDDVSDYAGIAVGVIADADDVFGIAHLPQTMRTSPTISISSASHFRITTVFGPDQTCNAVQLGYAGATAPIIRATGASGGLTAGGARLITFNASTAGWIDFSAEL